MSPILKPDRDQMLQHLELLFGRALGGRLEISGLDEAARPRMKTRFFDVDVLDGAADFAMEINSEPGRNVYVGASLRREDVFSGRAGDDDDFLKTYAVWADADNDAQVEAARGAYHDLGVTPPLVVVTGRVPTKRAQFWWPLETPLDDIDALRAMLRGIAAVLKTDPKVCTGKQLMRLAGGVAWPKKEGRVLERAEIVRPSRAAREFSAEQLERAFPPLSRALGAAASIDTVDVQPAGALGLGEVIADGREGYAFKLVRAHLHELIGTTGAEPDANALYRSVAPVYLAKVDQVRPGRGPEFLKLKCAEALRAFHAGQIPFMRTLEEAVLSYAARVRGDGGEAAPFAGDDFAPAAATPADTFEVLSIADIKGLPDAEWIVHEAIPRGGLGFVYGAPGSYKSFVCYDLALSLAYRRTAWLDRPIKHDGSVLYLASEGAQGAKNRIGAWQQARGIEADDGAFRLIRTSISFMRTEDIEKLERTVAAVVEASGPVDTVFVDTVSRVLPGADENLQKDMTLFVAACDRLRERFGATVIGVHHTNKNGDMRGSTVFLGQGDFVMRLDKDEAGKGGVLTCEKEKEAEDGWKAAFEVDVQCWTPAGRLKQETSLAVRWIGRPSPEAAGDAWPSKELCRLVLNEIEGAWARGKPWSPYPRAATEGRYAVSNIASDFGIKAATVQMMISAWLKNEILGFETFDKHSKTRGLKVLRRPGNGAETRRDGFLSD